MLLMVWIPDTPGPPIARSASECQRITVTSCASHTWVEEHRAAPGSRSIGLDERELSRTRRRVVVVEGHFEKTAGKGRIYGENRVTWSPLNGGRCVGVLVETDLSEIVVPRAGAKLKSPAWRG